METDSLNPTWEIVEIESDDDDIVEIESDSKEVTRSPLSHSRLKIDEHTEKEQFPSYECGNL